MKRAWIKKRKSKRVSDYDKEFEAMKPKIHVRSGYLCEAWRFIDKQHFASGDPDLDAAFALFMKVRCETYVIETHHRKYRSRGGSNSDANLLDLCRAHHRFAHAHGGFGQAANLLRLSLSAGESERL